MSEVARDMLRIVWVDYGTPSIEVNDSYDFLEYISYDEKIPTKTLSLIPNGYVVHDNTLYAWRGVEVPLCKDREVTMNEVAEADLHGLLLNAEEIVAGLKKLQGDYDETLSLEISDKIVDLREAYDGWNMRRLADWGNQ